MNLLIVEDEDIIRKGLAITVQKLDLPFEHIYEAGDGEEGLRLCELYHPDIIMTDIRMPLMDGLTFIREAQKKSASSQFIILSGYNDFEYARTAIQYQVKDYLLKPSSRTEIQEVLTKIISEIEKQKKEHQELTTRLDTYEQTLDRYQKLFLGNVLLGRYPTDKIQTYFSQYAIVFPENHLLTFCYRIIPNVSTSSVDTDYKRHTEWLHSIISSYFTFSDTDILAGYSCLILSFPKETLRNLSEIWKEITEKIQDYQLFSGIRIYFAVSYPAANCCELPVLYQETCNLLDNRMFFPDEVFLPAPSVSSVWKQPIIPGAVLESLYHCFIGKSQFDLRQNFLAFLRYLTQDAQSGARNLFYGLEKASSYLLINLIRENSLSDHSELFHFPLKEALLLCNDREELFSYLYNSLSNYRKITLNGDTETYANSLSPVDQAIAYIDQNYYKELDLTLVSDLISMNSSYFSSLFKKKTGFSFSTYLQNVRLEKAKNLLLHSNQKLYEISDAVGFNNDKYFCKLFKEYTGMTPSAFKKQFESTPS